MTTNMTPNWLKIDKNNLPKGEVVAANFIERGKSGNDCYGEKRIGKLRRLTSRMFFRKIDIVYCQYVPVTHYLPLPKDEERE